MVDYEISIVVNNSSIVKLYKTHLTGLENLIGVTVSDARVWLETNILPILEGQLMYRTSNLGIGASISMSGEKEFLPKELSLYANATIDAMIAVLLTNCAVSLTLHPFCFVDYPDNPDIILAITGVNNQC
jgi:hypothetical protein